MNFKELKSVIDAGIDPALRKELQKLLNEGQKIQAMSILQQKLKLGLKNSKDILDNFEKSQCDN